jgi:hypothetical protein
MRMRTMTKTGRKPLNFGVVNITIHAPTYKKLKQCYGKTNTQKIENLIKIIEDIFSLKKSFEIVNRKGEKATFARVDLVDPRQKENDN